MKQIYYRTCLKCNQKKEISNYANGYRICSECRTRKPSTIKKEKVNPDINGQVVIGEKKYCSRCGELLELKCFTKTKHTTSGYHSSCKICKGNKFADVEEYKNSLTKHRRCTKCKQLLPLSDFNNTSTTCTKCRDKRLNRMAETRKKKEEQKAINISKMWWLDLTEEELKENRKKKKKRYYENHKEEMCLKARAYRERKRKEGTFIEGNRDTVKRRCASQRRKARKLGLSATFAYKQWIECKEYFNNRCAYCGKEDSLAQEHFIASANGGGYEKSNIVPSCMMCNSHKRDLDFFEWYSQQEFYSKEREQKILKYLGYGVKTVSA